MPPRLKAKKTRSPTRCKVPQNSSRSASCTRNSIVSESEKPDVAVDAITIGQEQEGCHICTKIKIVLVSMVAPLPLIYLNLRCEKNLCILYQAPLVIPTYTSAYFSQNAFTLFMGFVAFQAFWSAGFHHLFQGVSQGNSGQIQSSRKISQGFFNLLFFISLLIGLSAFWPDVITAIRREHLKLLMTVWVVCLCFSALQVLAVSLKNMLSEETHTGESWLKLFYDGSDVINDWVNIDLQHFTYVNIGLIGWAILDLLMILNSFQDGKLYNPAVFIVVSQLMYIGHTVYSEHILMEKPYLDVEKIGYNWLQRVVLFLPFLSSLVTSCSVVSNFDINPAVLLCNAVFFIFGFVVHTSSLQQMQRFLKDPKKAIEMDSLPGKVTGFPNKRFLVSGYWSFVHKPDLLGLLIMWMSWTIAGGLNAMSLLVFGCWLFIMMAWAKESDEYNRSRFPQGWEDYNDVVSRMLIPYLY